jgi:Ni,Fe-hydrogenase I cytochrome b subunit
MKIIYLLPLVTTLFIILIFILPVIDMQFPLLDAYIRSINHFSSLLLVSITALYCYLVFLTLELGRKKDVSSEYDKVMLFISQVRWNIVTLKANISLIKVDETQISEVDKINIEECVSFLGSRINCNLLLAF